MEERSSHSTYSTYQHMIPLILTSLLATTTPVQPALEDESWRVCEYMQYDLQQSVEFDIITPEQMNAILLRCLVNYS